MTRAWSAGYSSCVLCPGSIACAKQCCVFNAPSNCSRVALRLEMQDNPAQYNLTTVYGRVESPQGGRRAPGASASQREYRSPSREIVEGLSAFAVQNRRRVAQWQRAGLNSRKSRVRSPSLQPVVSSCRCGAGDYAARSVVRIRAGCSFSRHGNQTHHPQTPRTDRPPRARASLLRPGPRRKAMAQAASTDP